MRFCFDPKVFGGVFNTLTLCLLRRVAVKALQSEIFRSNIKKCILFEFTFIELSEYRT